jgi:hypothetical protein
LIGETAPVFTSTVAIAGGEVIVAQRSTMVVADACTPDKEENSIG